MTVNESVSYVVLVEVKDLDAMKPIASLLDPEATKSNILPESRGSSGGL